MSTAAGVYGKGMNCICYVDYCNIQDWLASVLQYYRGWESYHQATKLLLVSLIVEGCCVPPVSTIAGITLHTTSVVIPRCNQHGQV